MAVPTSVSEMPIWTGQVRSETDLRVWGHPLEDGVRCMEMVKIAVEVSAEREDEQSRAELRGTPTLRGLLE